MDPTKDCYICYNVKTDAKTCPSCTQSICTDCHSQVSRCPTCRYKEFGLKSTHMDDMYAHLADLILDLHPEHTLLPLVTTRNNKCYFRYPFPVEFMVHETDLNLIVTVENRTYRINKELATNRMIFSYTDEIIELEYELAPFILTVKFKNADRYYEINTTDFKYSVIY